MSLREWRLSAGSTIRRSPSRRMRNTPYPPRGWRFEYLNELKSSRSWCPRQPQICRVAVPLGAWFTGSTTRTSAEGGARTELLFNSYQLVVLGDAFGTRHRAGLDVVRSSRNGEVGDKGVLGLTGPMRDDGLMEHSRPEPLGQQAPTLLIVLCKAVFNRDNREIIDEPRKQLDHPGRAQGRKAALSKEVQAVLVKLARSGPAASPLGHSRPCRRPTSHGRLPRESIEARETSPRACARL